MIIQTAEIQQNEYFTIPCFTKPNGREGGDTHWHIYNMYLSFYMFSNQSLITASRSLQLYNDKIHNVHHSGLTLALRTSFYF